MRGLNLCPVVLAAWLAGAGSLQAGVYLLEPVPTLLPSLPRPTPIPFENVRQERENLQSADDRLYTPPAAPRPPSISRQFYLQRAAHLDARRKDGFFSARDAVTLSGCLLRLGRPAEAASVARKTLDGLGRKDPVRFLLLLNEACAYHEQMDFQLLPRAIESQSEALRSWPDLWAGWDQEQWRWQRRVEQLTLTWMRLRLREQLNNNGQLPATPSLDPLFDTTGQKVRFVGPGGKYQAGAIAFEEENKLPRDDENLVIALILAHPYEDRLYWLYGELLNAHGKVRAARDILGTLVGSGLHSRELQAHRAVLFADKAGFALSDLNNQEAPLRKLFWAMAPRGQLLGGGLADMSHEAAWLAVLIDPQQPGEILPFDGPRSSGGGVTPESRERLPSWRETLIGFAAGVVVGVLAALQWLEWRRRRREPVRHEPLRVPHSEDD